MYTGFSCPVNSLYIEVGIVFMWIWRKNNWSMDCLIIIIWCILYVIDVKMNSSAVSVNIFGVEEQLLVKPLQRKLPGGWRSSHGARQPRFARWSQWFGDRHGLRLFPQFLLLEGCISEEDQHQKSVRMNSINPYHSVLNAEAKLILGVGSLDLHLNDRWARHCRQLHHSFVFCVLKTELVRNWNSLEYCHSFPKCEETEGKRLWRCASKSWILFH